MLHRATYDSIISGEFTDYTLRSSVIRSVSTGMSPQFSVTFICCFLVALVLARYTGSGVTVDVPGNTRAGSPGVCPGCATPEGLRQLPQADVVRLHVERIKRELLRKLGLSAPPNVTGIPLPSFHSLPQPLQAAPGDDFAEEDGVFPDIYIDTAAAMSDDGGSLGQEYRDYYQDDEEEDYADDDEDGSEEEHDVDAELGPPEPPPRTKQIIVFGQQRTSTTNYFKASSFN